MNAQKENITTLTSAMVRARKIAKEHYPTAAWLAEHHFESIDELVELIVTIKQRDERAVAAVVRLRDLHGLTREELHIFGGARASIIFMVLDGQAVRRILDVHPGERYLRVVLAESKLPTIDGRMNRYDPAKVLQVVLRYRKGMSYAGIAFECGVTYSQIPNMMQQAVRSGLIHPDEYRTRIDKMPEGPSKVKAIEHRDASRRAR